MTEWLFSWIRSQVAASLLSELALQLTPEGGVTRGLCEAERSTSIHAAVAAYCAAARPDAPDAAAAEESTGRRARE